MTLPQELQRQKMMLSSFFTLGTFIILGIINLMSNREQSSPFLSPRPINDRYFIANHLETGFLRGDRENDKSEMSLSSTFNQENPHPDWCPLATCHNSLKCSPCQKRFLLIITAGNVGSTILPRMINLLPGIRLSVEYAYELTFLAEAYNNLESEIEERGEGGHSMMLRGALACSVQDVVKVIDSPSMSIMENSRALKKDEEETIIGFNTLQLPRQEGIHETVDFIKRAFPCARILIDYHSNEESQTKLQKSNDAARENIEREVVINNSKLMSIAREFGESQARILDIDGLKNGNGLEELNEILRWLGFQGCEFDKLDNENNDDAHTKVGPHCQYPQKGPQTAI